MKKIVVLGLLVMVLAFGLFSCDTDNEQKDSETIAGTWENLNASPKSRFVIYNNNGVYTFDMLLNYVPQNTWNNYMKGTINVSMPNISCTLTHYFPNGTPELGLDSRR